VQLGDGLAPMPFSSNIERSAALFWLVAISERVNAS
jgi:hypothetical protein